MTEAEIRELRSQAAIERLYTPAERAGDKALACTPNDWPTHERLQRLGQLHTQYSRPHGCCDYVTPAGRRVLAEIERRRP